MTESQDDSLQSPWLTLWVGPGRAIERIVATDPRRLVWVLAALGSIAGLYGQMVRFGAAGPPADWRFWLGLVLLGAIIGIVALYPSAWVLSGIGRLLGGRASPLELRAALAWSGLPAILGFIIVLAIGATMGGAMRSVLTLIATASALWSVIVFLLMLARVENFGFWRTIATYGLYFLVALFLAMVVRTFLYQPFNVPSGAMSPTLLNGDYFFLSKYAYGYTRYSLPFSPPLFSGRVLGAEPQRGDVVVFRLARDGGTDYVKRVVGLPGDRVQMKDGQLYINDQPMVREQVADYAGIDLCGSELVARVKRWRETLPNSASFETLDCVNGSFLDDTYVFTVPQGHLFVLGDNRDNSTDSRMPSQVGYVPIETVIGRAGLIFFSVAPGTGAVRTERIGTMVR